MFIEELQTHLLIYNSLTDSPIMSLWFFKSNYYIIYDAFINR